MGIVRTLHGSGMSKNGGKHLGIAEYNFDIFRDGDRLSGHGWIEAQPGVLQASLMATELTINRRDTGNDISIVVTQITPAGKRAVVMINGSPD